jgi:phage N-6-adenine-methyltransferase
MAELYKAECGDVAHYNPSKGLETIAVAEIGEKYWARAKDPQKLYEAIEAKITAQAEYVVWRDSVVVPSQESGAPGRGKRVSAQKPVLPAADPDKLTIHRWRKKLCSKVNGKTAVDEQKLRTVIDQAKIALALEDARHRSYRICEQEPRGTERGTAGTGEFERYTPGIFIEAARKVLGEIDLDPVTSEQAQQTVQAARYFTAESNGLVRNWDGRVWLNPPYHRELAPKFIDKLVAEVEAGRVTAAVMLTNNSTDTDWFNVAIRACDGLCFTHGRINFTQPNGQEVLPTQGQAFFYFGPDVLRFEDVFCVIGPCVRPSRQFAGGG